MAKTKVNVNGSIRWCDIELQNKELTFTIRAKSERGYYELPLDFARYDLHVTPLHLIERIIRGEHSAKSGKSYLTLIDENNRRHIMEYDIERMLNAIRKAVVASYL